MKENSNFTENDTQSNLAWWQQIGAALLSKPEITNSRKLRHTLFYLIFFRVLIVISLLLSSLWSVLASNADQSKITLIYWTLAVTVVISLGNALWLRKGRQLYILGYSQLVFDVVLSTIVVIVTGGTVSPFIFLYLLVILEATIIFKQHGAVIVAAFSGIAYAILVSDVLPTLGNEKVVASPQHIFGAYVALIVIALISSYLARQLEIAGKMAKSYEKDLTELTNRQKQFLDDISEGIITLDLESAISNINQAAKAIIGLTEFDAQTMIGQPISSVLNNYGVHNVGQLLKKSQLSTEPEEIVLVKPGSLKELRLNFLSRTLNDSAGNEVGQMITINDVSHIRDMEDLLSLHEKMTKLLASEDKSIKLSTGQTNIHMVGESPIMKQVFSLVDRVSSSDASVLITGESGTGKELIARTIHGKSQRGLKPFVAINCSAMPENLIESELFGHRKGSFTGAVRDTQGLFKQADGGTIFLDEVGELPLHLQTKLLRVLQDKSVRAVGDVSDFIVDVRVIAATNKDLKEEIKAGKFREDLFYRLNVVNIMLPPLRRRKEDIPHLVRYFIGQIADPNGVLPQISPEALQLLMSYPFPGNIRELENLIERALVLSSSAILPEHFPDEVVTSIKHNGEFIEGSIDKLDLAGFPVDLEKELEKIEKLLLFQALERTGGAKKQAAELLGLNFRSFRYRIKKYGLPDTDSPE
jgi:two-component system, NtrC family, response regulator PilR